MRAITIAAVLLGACAPYEPPTQQPQSRGSVAVDAPFDSTWNAVIDVFADQNIPISTIDRASGFIAADVQRVGDWALAFADCGTGVGDQPIAPTGAVYNVVVREVGSRETTLRVTPRWTSINGPFECVSTGTFEETLEEIIAANAEGRPPRVSLPEVVTRCAERAYASRQVGGGWSVVVYDSDCEPRTCEIQRGGESDAIAACEERHSVP